MGQGVFYMGRVNIFGPIRQGQGVVGPRCLSTTTVCATVCVEVWNS